jgi:4-alpha-glucanotransferase
VWQHLELFDTHLLAGSPPDMYNEEGQNWGFPIFNWDALKKTHFDWWKQRLGYAQNFFDIYRVDHIIGYFRIWTIPPNHLSIEGHFIPEDEKQWEPQGRELLTMLASSTSMLPIGENLGIVPKLVDLCMDEFGICGTKVLRWARNWEEDKSFIPIEDYPPVNLTCISTHDSETLTLWWTRYSSESKAYAEYKNWTWEPLLTDKQREEIVWDSHHTPTLFHVNLLQEYLAFFPELSWPNPEDERINIPGTILPTNWAYRFRPSVEEIISHKELFLKMRKVIFAPALN